METVGEAYRRAPKLAGAPGVPTHAAAWIPPAPSCRRAGRQRHPRVLQVFIQAHAVPGLAQDARQRRLADLDRLPPQVRAVQLQQVEGIQKRLRLVPAGGGAGGMQSLLRIATHHLAIDQAAAHLEGVTALPSHSSAVALPYGLDCISIRGDAAPHRRTPERGSLSLPAAARKG